LKIFKTPIGCRYSVLGFGDRQFPAFCQFAQDVDIALAATGMLPLLPMTTIHQQSAQSFHQWGVQLSKKMNLPFSLEHQPLQPKTQTWRLISRIDYSKDDSPTAVLRFELDTQHKGNIKFNAGDLVGILAPGSMVPRYYSLASSCNDGYLEICVRKHHEGQCSSFLHGLKTGETISAFVQINANFRPKKSNSAVILIGAGTGIGPLAGFIRHNTDHHPMHLYWGGRHPDRDFLYQEELNDYLTDHRLTEFKAAFSRHDDRAYVQDRLRTDQLLMRQLIESGAQILVCGGRDMAAGVSATLDDILAPLNQSVQTLKAQGRLVEDVY